MLWQVFRQSTGWYYYKKTNVQMWLSVSSSLHNNSNYNFGSNQYTTTSTNHLHAGLKLTKLLHRASLGTDQIISTTKILMIIHLLTCIYITCIILTEITILQVILLEWWWHSWPRLYVCIHEMITWPWRWPEYRPKHVGENIVNKIRQRYWSALVGYLHVLDLIKTRKMEHTY